MRNKLQSPVSPEWAAAEDSTFGRGRCYLRFTRANEDRIAELLQTLVSLGRARELADGNFLAV